MNNRPIGVLDSGLGGLTVLQEIVHLLPQESIVYIADSKNTPYGVKSPDEIFDLAKKSIDFLLTQNIKMVVTACNSITVNSVDRLRAHYPHLLLVGIVPAMKPAGEQTKNKRIGVLATTSTAQSVYQDGLINRFAADCQIVNIGTDELVPLIEAGKIQGGEMTEVLTRVLVPFQKAEIDTLVLGCTHFPFLKEQIQMILGSSVTIIDSGEAIARRVKWLLEDKRLVAEQKEPSYAFYTTGDPEIAKNVLHATIAREEEFKKISS